MRFVDRYKDWLMFGVFCTLAFAVWAGFGKDSEGTDFSFTPYYGCIINNTNENILIWRDVLAGGTEFAVLPPHSRTRVLQDWDFGGKIGPDWRTEDGNLIWRKVRYGENLVFNNDGTVISQVRNTPFIELVPPMDPANYIPGVEHTWTPTNTTALIPPTAPWYENPLDPATSLPIPNPPTGPAIVEMFIPNLEDIYQPLQIPIPPPPMPPLYPYWVLPSTDLYAPPPIPPAYP